MQNLSTSARLDRALVDVCTAGGLDFSRAKIQDLIKSGHVSVNGETVTKPRQPVENGDEVWIEFQDEFPGEILPDSSIELPVLFEDDDLIVIDKPHGIVVHPGSGNPDGTVVNALLHHCDGKLSRAADPDRPGIVHRLDKDTSGCLVVAKSDPAYHGLVEQFSGRETRKTYLAVVAGRPGSEEGRIENRISRHPVHRQKMTVLEAPAGKEAITEFRVLHSAENSGWSLLECRIFTGRTHQIRVHLKENLHTPILGDPIYGNPKKQKPKTGRLMLHAWKLGFRHPVTGEEMNFESPVPEPFLRFRKD
ncbi:MAG: RluA family pseudouridine synthase [Verrucomicrobiales bacterium]|nr:RluA family pseudouridine synthase [Verrucomicrobiales bacterium]